MFLRERHLEDDPSAIIDDTNESGGANWNWTLSRCCGDEELVFLSLMCGYLLANFFLWNTALLKPMKLIAVFVHEMSHATACWMTGGKVTAIEVYNNEGEFALMCTVPLY